MEKKKVTISSNIQKTMKKKEQEIEPPKKKTFATI